MLENVVVLILGGVAGALVGSFLNVVIYRLPRMMANGTDTERARADHGADGLPVQAVNLAVPRSFCPTCHRPVRAVENIPLLSYCLLRGRCAGCGSRISPRYLLVEALGMVGAVASVWAFGPTVQGVAAAVFLWLGIAIAFIDIEHLMIPDRLSMPMLWTGLLVNAWGTFTDAQSAVLGAAAGYGLFWSIDALGRRWIGRTLIGGGDFKLLAGIGAWLGWQSLAPILLIGCTLGALIGLVLIGAGRRDRGQPIGFAPFLVIGGAAVLISDNHISDWIAWLARI